jgi:hypothetical protein
MENTLDLRGLKGLSKRLILDTVFETLESAGVKNARARITEDLDDIGLLYYGPNDYLGWDRTNISYQNSKIFNALTDLDAFLAIVGKTVEEILGVKVTIGKNTIDFDMAPLKDAILNQARKIQMKRFKTE